MSFQNFDIENDAGAGVARLRSLRQAMAEAGLQGFVVPRADAHQGEYVADCDARLAWLTGFTGSAGFCAVLRETAGVFVDGRYRVQVRAQTDMAAFTPVDWPETKLGDWLKTHAARGDVIGYDPWLHSADEIEALETALDGTGIALAAVEQNLVDHIWADRPAPPQGRAFAQPIELTGQGSGDKRAAIAQKLRAAGQAAAVLTLPDSICWLLNIRGTDIPRVPILQCFAIVHDDARVDLFVAAEKIADLGPDPAITTHPPEDFADHVAGLTGKVRLEKSSAPIALSHRLRESSSARLVYGRDPCALPKACKNPVEIEGARAAHLRDAEAMVQFLAWLDAQQPGRFTEIDVVKALEGFRRQTNALHDISFDTISGAGPNGAVVHYRVTQETNRVVEPDSLLLVDSGGQYVDGTTDITRTIAIGDPGAEARACFTRVLQGMIAISTARFPRGLAGRDLDALARAPLWRAGLDYDHGTGHGVGAFLSVHEGPQRLSRQSEVPLEPGMILSNEPGYYREGAFGIRIENLIVVAPAPELGDKRDQLAFETLTFVPIDRRLILREMLSPEERAWIDRYHAACREKLSPEGSAGPWLEQATAPL